MSRQAHDVPDERWGPEETAAGEQVKSALQEAISSLDPMYREVLVLRDVEWLSAAEVLGRDFTLKGYERLGGSALGAAREASRLLLRAKEDMISTGFHVDAGAVE